jgi:hypothetical protein
VVGQKDHLGSRLVESSHKREELLVSSLTPWLESRRRRQERYGVVIYVVAAGVQDSKINGFASPGISGGHTIQDMKVEVLTCKPTTKLLYARVRALELSRRFVGKSFSFYFSTPSLLRIIVNPTNPSERRETRIQECL